MMTQSSEAFLTGPLAFPRKPVVSRETFESLRGRKAKLAWVALFNNCIVKAWHADTALIFATPFVCEGIARDGGFNVYRSPIPGHYVVDFSRIGLRVA